ncbi:toprim domain-containing protein, partial [Flavobacterium frigoris]
VAHLQPESYPNLSLKSGTSSTGIRTSFLLERVAHHQLVYPPSKTKGENVWFLSPFRKETTPSLKIDTNRNLWYDFGEGAGGKSVLDFVIRLKNCSVKEALENLKNDTFSFHQQEIKITETNCYSILKMHGIKNAHLIAYLRARKINLEFAQQFCVEIHYALNIEKEYYGIGFKNNTGGFEVRNKFFKGCLGSKSITTICNDSDVVSLFESWSDFLSYLTLKKETPKEDFIILNSTSLVKKAIELLARYSEIKVFFDNDEAGDRATNLVLESTKNTSSDIRVHYKNHNDLNEYLVKKKLIG